MFEGLGGGIEVDIEGRAPVELQVGNEGGTEGGLREGSKGGLAASTQSRTGICRNVVMSNCRTRMVE